MKNNWIVTTLILLLTFGFTTKLIAQNTGADSFHAHHTIGILIGHTQVSQGIVANGNRQWLSLPSWSINYNYKFNKKWAIGLHNDIITESFEVEEHLGKTGNAVLKRSYPVATAIMASFKPKEHFNFLFGAGGEFAHEANYFLIRVGAEYVYHLSKTMEINACIANDLKVNAYNSWTIGFGITKRINL